MSLVVEVDRTVRARRPSRSPDKAALAYLAASGAAAITVIEQDGGCTIRVGGDSTAAQYWVDAGQAIQIARKARRAAGAAADLSTVTAALHASATSVGATLTLNEVAIARATDAATRLDSYLDAMRRSGTLREFNAQFKRRRMEATANGRGFMNYKVAEARLRAALIPMLVGGGRHAVGAGMFAEIFGAA